MPKLPTVRGVILTVGFVTDVNRFQCVMPYAAESAVPDPSDVAIDFSVWALGDLWTDWRLLLCDDCYLAGMTVESMAGDDVVPFRTVVPPGSLVGQAEGDSTPPQTSCLISWYSEDQIAEPERTIVGKSFVGPADETKCQSGIISDGAYFTLLTNLGITMKGFTGGTTGVAWKRVLGIDRNPANEVWVADVPMPRQTLFTQKRRMMPLF